MVSVSLSFAMIPPRVGWQLLFKLLDTRCLFKIVKMKYAYRLPYDKLTHVFNRQTQFKYTLYEFITHFIFVVSSECTSNCCITVILCTTYDGFPLWSIRIAEVDLRTFEKLKVPVRIQSITVVKSVLTNLECILILHFRIIYVFTMWYENMIS